MSEKDFHPVDSYFVNDENSDPLQPTIPQYHLHSKKYKQHENIS